MVATWVIIIKFANLNFCSNKFQISLSHVAKWSSNPQITDTSLEYLNIYLCCKISAGRQIHGHPTWHKARKRSILIFGGEKTGWKMKRFFRFFEKGSFGLSYSNRFPGLIYFMVFRSTQLTTGSRWHTSETGSECCRMRGATTQPTPSLLSPHLTSTFQEHLLYVSSTTQRTLILSLRQLCWPDFIISVFRMKNSDF